MYRRTVCTKLQPVKDGSLPGQAAEVLDLPVESNTTELGAPPIRHAGVGSAELSGRQAVLQRLLHGLHYKRRRLVTDGLRSHGIAQRAILPNVHARMTSLQAKVCTEIDADPSLCSTTQAATLPERFCKT
jgi:hypothetical protein